MRLFKRGKVYWYELVFEGRRIQRSTKATNQRIAAQVMSAEHTRLIRGEAGLAERRKLPAFSEAIKQFLAWSEQEHKAHPNTWKRYKTSSKPLVAYFGQVKLDDITSAEVEAYKLMRSTAIGKRTKRPLRPASVNRELAALKACFNHHAKASKQLHNPVSEIKFLNEENEQDRVLTFEEQRKYLEKATPVLRDVTLLLLETGCRPEEIYTAQGRNVDLERRILRIVRGKTKAARRQVELTEIAAAVLGKRIEEHGEGFLFPKKGHPDQPMPKVANAHERAVRDSGVKPFPIYACRHTFATRAIEAGVDAATLAAMLGHSKLQMVTRYAHIGQAHQMSAMQKIAANNAAREAKQRAAQSGMKLVQSA